MNGTVCGWCAERLAELRTEMQKGEGHGNDEAEKEVSRRRQGAETHVPDAHGTELLHEQLRSEENAGTGDQVQREAEAALSNVKSGNYLIRCRTETGWREEVMPHRLIGPIEDCRPLYIEGSAFDIDRFSRGEVDPRLQSRCAYRSYWPRAMIDSLPTLGSGPARVVEMVSVYKRDGTRDGRVFDTVEVECRGEVCELWHPYFQCDADPFHLRLVFTLGVGR